MQMYVLVNYVAVVRMSKCLYCFIILFFCFYANYLDKSILLYKDIIESIRSFSTLQFKQLNPKQSNTCLSDKEDVIMQPPIYSKFP